MSKQKRILISRDQAAIDNFKQGLAVMLPLVKNIVGHFETLNVGKVETTSDLRRAYEIPKDFYKEKQLASFELNEAFKEMKFTKEHVVNMRQWTDPTNFYNAVEAAGIKFPNANCSIRDFILDENSNVIIDQELVNAYTEVHSNYAETDKEIKLYTALSKAAEALEDVRSAYKEITGVGPFNIAQLKPHEATFASFETENIDHGHYIQVTSEITKVVANYSLVTKSKNKNNHALA